ncbi:MAG: hypothetical protein P4L27_05385 [Ignavibacteriaceae bacterium]|nr:hypothetical protein [Ignavibacteriaceae bacterium]
MEETIKGTSVSVILRWVNYFENKLNKETLYSINRIGGYSIDQDSKTYAIYLNDIFGFSGILNDTFPASKDYYNFTRKCLQHIRDIISGK